MRGKEEQGDLELVIVPGDGHCISHCFLKHFNQPLNEVLKCLKNDFISNVQHYEEFSDSLSKEEILQTVDEYIKSKKYNNGTTDLCTPCLLYTSPSPRDQRGYRMPSSA